MGNWVGLVPHGLQAGSAPPCGIDVKAVTLLGMPLASRWLPVFLFGHLALFACDGGDETDSHADGDAGHDGDTGAHAESGETHDEEQGDCAAETRDDEFAIGLAKSGALVHASFVSASPAPPIKGDNTWVIELSDLGGQPLSDVSVVAIPMMPDHGHGTPVAAEVSAMETPGHYEITPVNLFMTGYWEITLELTLAAGEQDSLMFGFCVD